MSTRSTSVPASVPAMASSSAPSSASASASSSATGEVVARVTEIIDEAFGLADRIAAGVEAVFTAGFAAGRLVRQDDLGEIAAIVKPALDDPASRLQGAGFVAAVDTMADAPWWLEWFMRRQQGRAERLVVDTDPRGENFYDYVALPWYHVPRDTGRRHVTGPYVDYLCTDDYTLTFTVPVTAGRGPDDRSDGGSGGPDGGSGGDSSGGPGGRFVGVAGADVRVPVFERAVLPALRRCGRPVAVVNAQGRVVLSNDAHHVGGTLVRTPDVAALWSSDQPVPGLHRLSDLPLGLLDL